MLRHNLDANSLEPVRLMKILLGNFLIVFFIKFSSLIHYINSSVQQSVLKSQRTRTRTYTCRVPFIALKYTKHNVTWNSRGGFNNWNQTNHPLRPSSPTAAHECAAYSKMVRFAISLQPIDVDGEPRMENKADRKKVYIIRNCIAFINISKHHTLSDWLTAAFIYIYIVYI